MSLLSFLTKTELPKEQDALLGRNEKIFEPMIHFVNKAQYPKDSKNLEKVYFGMGCFWGEVYVGNKWCSLHFSWLWRWFYKKSNL